jgi:hypothetical protein
MQNIYGVWDNGVHIDICNTEIGAKRYATLNGYNIVTIRYNCGYNAEKIAKKNKGGRWIKI